MAEITYLAGDATSPQAKGTKVIAHICNNRGEWGKGFVRAISKRWSEPEAAYRRWHRGRSGNDFGLGAVQLVRVTPDIWVANMIGQAGGTGSSRSSPANSPIRASPSLFTTRLTLGEVHRGNPRERPFAAASGLLRDGSGRWS
ncbi:hypothetical protein [Actinomadura monticuli]|uniref:Appr-1-p processing protein n=1 Tax=Actinomadura monticuli TaxID=3097367 RepID=A0ABV4QEH7_9ACTN